MKDQSAAEILARKIVDALAYEHPGTLGALHPGSSVRDSAIRIIAEICDGEAEAVE